MTHGFHHRDPATNASQSVKPTMSIIIISSDSLLPPSHPIHADTRRKENMKMKWKKKKKNKQTTQAMPDITGPVSHQLSRSEIQAWKNSIKHARENTSTFIAKWPCMYCQRSIDLSSLKDQSRFRCANETCVGRGKLQVTCYWKIKGKRGGEE